MERTPLTPEFRAFLSLLNERGIRYLVVGGYAVGFHGAPRYTKDIDIWIAVDPENAERISQAVLEFFDATKPPERFLASNLILRIGVAPNMIEIITTISGVEFESCYCRREQVELDGLTIPIIGLQDLRKNKKASGRHIDLADVDNLPPA